MVLKFSVKANQVKQNYILRADGPKLHGFPALYIDRYSYMGETIVRTAYGEGEQLYGNKMWYMPEAAYALHVGAFTSIAWDTNFIIDQDHDYESVAMTKCDLFCHGPSRHRRRGSVIIQNDVWIGQNCTIYGGVTIHNGAVVAGNSVVTKDVPPYCIVGGAPARFIKLRFDEGTIQKLLAIQWWNWSEEEIRRNQEWFAESPEKFADYFYDILPKRAFRDAGIPHYRKTYLFFPDFDEYYGVWKYVVMEFCRAFAEKEDYGLVMFVEKSDMLEEMYQQIEELTKDVEALCNLYVYAGEPEDEEVLFSFADYYITSRSLQTVRRTCLADQFGVPIISGVDIPIFS